MKEYRLNVRFCPEDDAQRAAVEFLQQLDRTQFKSRNAFAVKAICDYVERLREDNPYAGLLEDFRQVLREELPAMTISAPEPPKTLDVELTEAQKKTNARNVLAALEAF